MAYLNSTRELGLCLGAGKDGKFRLNVYTDASFNVHQDAKSHGGVVINVGRSANLAESTRIPGIPLSSTEAELIMGAHGTSLGYRELEFAKCQQIVDDNEPGLIHQDNKSTIHLIKNGKSTSKKTK